MSNKKCVLPSSRFAAPGGSPVADRLSIEDLQPRNEPPAFDSPVILPSTHHCGTCPAGVNSIPLRPGVEGPAALLVTSSRRTGWKEPLDGIFAQAWSPVLSDRSASRILLGAAVQGPEVRARLSKGGVEVDRRLEVPLSSTGFPQATERNSAVVQRHDIRRKEVQRGCPPPRNSSFN